MLEINKKVVRLAEIKKEIEVLNTEKKELEAYFLSQGAADIEDTKYKSKEFIAENGSKVTYTEAQGLKITAPAYLKKLFDVAYPDIIKEDTETKYKVTAPNMERMLIGLYTGNFTRITPAEVIEQLPCDVKIKKALAKKLKGANFDTDLKNLIAAGFSDLDAVDYAYLYSEAVVWDTFIKTLQLSGMEVDDVAIDRMIKGINISVQVEDTTRIKVG